jgi:hypothetical protein
MTIKSVEDIRDYLMRSMEALKGPACHSTNAQAASLGTQKNEMGVK